MSPRTASTSQLDRLIVDLRSDDTVRRDAAVARLRVIGAAAVPRLAAVIASPGSPSARTAAFDALDGIADRRVPELAVGALGDDAPEIVVAALGVLRAWVARESGTRLLETLTAIATDRERPARVRVAAIEALADLPDELTAPIRAHAPPPESAGPPLDDPVAAREWVEAYGATAELPLLHDVITSFRECEQAARATRERLAWLAARGAAHCALSARRSRLALFDLRETLAESDGPLPDGFVEAAAAIGDASCLEPLARAWAASTRDASWRTRLQTTARDILRRARLTGRNTTVKSVRAKWPGFV